VTRQLLNFNPTAFSCLGVFIALNSQSIQEFNHAKNKTITAFTFILGAAGWVGVV
jgi:hypothetical protein